jgi:hypothetical protein
MATTTAIRGYHMDMRLLHQEIPGVGSSAPGGLDAVAGGIEGSKDMHKVLSEGVRGAGGVDGLDGAGDLALASPARVVGGGVCASASLSSPSSGMQNS